MILRFKSDSFVQASTITVFRLAFVLFASICLFPVATAAALDIECKFSGERGTTLYRDLVSGENISYVGKKDDPISKKEVFWGDDFVTIIVETTGMATLVVINTNDYTATKRVTRAGISKGEARGWCRPVE